MNGCENMILKIIRMMMKECAATQTLFPPFLLNDCCQSPTPTLALYQNSLAEDDPKRKFIGRNNVT